MRDSRALGERRLTHANIKGAQRCAYAKCRSKGDTPPPALSISIAWPRVPESRTRRALWQRCEKFSRTSRAHALVYLRASFLCSCIAHSLHLRWVARCAQVGSARGGFAAPDGRRPGLRRTAAAVRAPAALAKAAGVICDDAKRFLEPRESFCATRRARRMRGGGGGAARVGKCCGVPTRRGGRAKRPDRQGPAEIPFFFA